MTSMVMEESKERGPRLTLSVAEPASASPFPSPSSSFLPPPLAGAHEFAVKPPPLPKNIKKNMITNGSTIASSEEHREPEPAEEAIADPSMASPTTPTPTSSQQSVRTQSDLFQPLQFASANTATQLPISRTLTPTSPTFNILSSGIHNPNRDSTASSLSSNRPAPPSPAVSRRTSTVLSRANSSRKSPAHRLSMQSATSKRDSFNMPNMTTSQTVTATPGSTISRRSLKPQPKVYIKIRDFAFPETDDRHTGIGTDVPKQNRVGFLNKHLRSNSTSSSSTASQDDEDEEKQFNDDEDDAWNNFQWGMGRLSWQFSAAGAARDDEADRPSNTDFDRNFAEDPTQLGDEDYEPEEEGPLQPGLYRAMYAFEPEGAAEMALQEDQIVRVIGRGGGVGWAVVDKAYVEENTPNIAPGEGHALVPESYLEPVKLDWPDDDQEDE